MSNNITSTLVNTVLSQSAVTKVQEKLAWFGAFTTDFSDEVRDQRSRSMLVPYVSGGSAVQTNPTNFETGDTYIAQCPITLAHISKSFYLTSSDIGTGRRLENLAKQNLAIVTNQLETLVFTLMTEALFGTAVTGLSGLSTGMTAANMKTLFNNIVGKNKVAILKDTVFSGLLPSDLNGYDITKQKSGYGFDYIDYTGAGFASAGTHVVGFGGSPGAIVMASAIPEYSAPVADLLDSEVVEVPDVGLSIQTNLWGSAASRNVWASYDILFGAAVGDASAGRVICGTV